MAWIRIVGEDEATGLLRRVYDGALRRAGRVFNIIRVQSRTPEALKAGADLYLATMYGKSELTRAQREMLAVVVSRVNECHY